MEADLLIPSSSVGVRQTARHEIILSGMREGRRLVEGQTVSFRSRFASILALGLLLVAVAASTSCIGGCGPTPALEGSWEGRYWGDWIVLTFHPDGTFEEALSGGIPGSGLAPRHQVGSWSPEGDYIVLKPFVLLVQSREPYSSSAEYHYSLTDEMELEIDWRLQDWILRDVGGEDPIFSLTKSK